jgi:CDGSH-type Zn-finger protein
MLPKTPNRSLRSVRFVARFPPRGRAFRSSMDIATPAPVKITVKPNGPLRVEGHILLVDADGKEWDLTGKPAISLCRCGASEKRPFCDGAHNRVGFQCMTSPGNLTGK